MSGYPPNPPAFNPSAPPQQSGVGFERYQQGANPSYSEPPPVYSPYPNAQSYQQQPYQPQSYSQAPYQGPMYAPQGNVVYREQQPNTVYVYQQDQRKKDNTDECLLFALCAACLCCCLMND